MVTRWVAPDPAHGSWAAYLEAWPFADVPPDDRLFDVVDELRGLTSNVVTAPTFGKWGPALDRDHRARPRTSCWPASPPTAASSPPRSRPPTPAPR